MKAAWDRGEDYYDPARKEDILGRTKTRLDLWEEHLKDPIVALAKALECLENPTKGWHLVSQCVVASPCRRNGLQHRWCKDFAKGVERALPGRRLALSGPMGRGAFTCIIQLLGCSQGKYGPHSELFFFLIRKEPVALTQAVPFKPFVSAETLKACALIGWHLLVAER